MRRQEIKSTILRPRKKERKTGGKVHHPEIKETGEKVHHPETEETGEKIRHPETNPETEETGENVDNFQLRT